jgi:hypothetical protein
MPEYHGISRNMPEYHGICRNITEYAGISRNITEFRDCFEALFIETSFSGFWWPNLEQGHKILRKHSQQH